MAISEKITKDKIKELFMDASSNHDKKVCFIFGAGASYGYTALTNRNTPPIVKDLFNTQIPIVSEVINRPEHATIKRNSQIFASRIANDFKGDLESYLSHVYEIDQDNNLFGKLLVYLQDLFISASELFTDDQNNYMHLIAFMTDYFKKDFWSCVSFNYDTLLEQSYMALDRDSSQRSFNESEGYAKAHPVILKPHGGINFRYAHLEPTTEYSNFKSYTEHFLFSSMMKDKNRQYFVLPPRFTKPDSVSKKHRFNAKTKNGEFFFQADFPLMLIPIHGKAQPENNYFIEANAASIKAISEADVIVSIGYNWGDKSLTDPLKDMNMDKKEIILVDKQTIFLKLERYSTLDRVRAAFKDNPLKLADCDGFGDFVSALY